MKQILNLIENERQKANLHDKINLIAVSKYVDENAIKILYNKGQTSFGENKVQDLKQKTEKLNSYNINWHFIGRLQKNKINHLIELNPTLVHSIDSYELALAYHERLIKKEKTQDILLQINSSKELSKAGVSPNKAIEIYEKIQLNCPTLKLKGIMSIGANSEDKAKIIDSFSITYEIFKQLKTAQICSMGMSGDFKLAIKCGSNMLRLGSILFKNIN